MTLSGLRRVLLAEPAPRVDVPSTDDRDRLWAEHGFALGPGAVAAILLAILVTAQALRHLG